MVSKRDFSTAQRKKLASTGAAMPDGSYPIKSEQDLKNAIRAIGRTQPVQRPAVRKHIKQRAKALGLENLIPDSWNNQRSGNLLKDLALTKREVITLEELDEIGKALNTRAPLDRSPKKNWVENAGGLPMYIRRIANHLHAEKGMTISHAIATAVNAAKKMCSSGDLNFPGKQNVNSGSHAEACAAVAEWEKKKASARVSKGIRGRKMTDEEYVKEIVGAFKKASPGKKVQVVSDLLGVENGYRNTSGLEISDEEFSKLAAEVDTPDDPDTEFEMSGEITKLDEDQRLAFGWASIGFLADGSVVDDKQGDVLDDVGEIEKSAYAFVTDCREGGEMHIRKGIGTLVESFVSTPEKWEAMGIPKGTLPVGWWVGFQVSDEEVWKSIKDGKYRMFSVHGRGTRKALD